MRRGASLDADQAWRQLLEECQHVSTLQLPADHHSPISINAVNLKDRLCDIETDCCDRLHARLLRIVGASTAPTSVALTRRWRSRPHGVIAGASCPSQSLVLEGGCSPIAWKYGLTTGRGAQASNGEQPWK